jgi:alpha-galactosidase
MPMGDDRLTTKDMKRRHFVQLSASWLAALLTARSNNDAYANNGPFPGDPMPAPDEVWLFYAGDWTRMKGQGGTRYHFQDTEVSLSQGPGGLSVSVRSPVIPLKYLRLKWRHDTPPATRCLGDQWERSYGDLAWTGPDEGKRQPWYILLHDTQNTLCYGVRTGCNSFCWWNIGPADLSLSMDLRSAGVGVELGERTLQAATILTVRNQEGENPFVTARRCCKIMCNHPRLPEKPVYGINDWYFAYGNNSPSLILEQTKLMTDLAPDTSNRPFSVVDAGWAAYSPLLPGDCCWQDDSSRPNEKFRDMAKLADAIKKENMRPGLWIRPLCAKHDDPTSLLLPAISGRDNPKNPLLDPSIPENLERIKQTVRLYKEWGYELVKHDFSTYDITGKWGFEMKEDITSDAWAFHDKTRTTAEIIKDLYQSIRDGAGEVYLAGCNTVSHLSAGLFETNRIGDDTSGKEWTRTRKMGVNTLAFRICQHGHFYSVDADCVGLTKDVPWEKNRQWMQLLAESGTPLFISTQPDALGTEQKEFVKRSFRQAASPQPIGEPLDWLSHPWPSEWWLDHRTVHFDWG